MTPTLLAAIRADQGGGPLGYIARGAAGRVRRAAGHGRAVQMVACTEFSLIADAAAPGAVVIDTLDALVDGIASFSLKRVDRMTIDVSEKGNGHRRDRGRPTCARQSRRCWPRSGKGGEDAVRRYARDLDKWQGDIVLSDDDRAAATEARSRRNCETISALPMTTSAALPRPRRPHITDCEVEIIPACAGQTADTGVVCGLLRAGRAL